MPVHTLTLLFSIEQTTKATWNGYRSLPANCLDVPRHWFHGRFLSSSLARRYHCELSRPSRLSKPQRIAVKSRVTKSTTKMMTIVMVCSFFLGFSACSFPKACFNRALEQGVLPQDVWPLLPLRSRSAVLPSHGKWCGEVHHTSKELPE